MEQVVWHALGSLKMLLAGNAAVSMIPEHNLCVANKKLEATFTKERNMNLLALLRLEPVGHPFKGLILDHFFLGNKKSIKLHNLLQINFTVTRNNVTNLNYSKAPEFEPQSKLQWTSYA